MNKGQNDEQEKGFTRHITIVIPFSKAIFQSRADRIAEHRYLEAIACTYIHNLTKVISGRDILNKNIKMSLITADASYDYSAFLEALTNTGYVIQ